MCSVKLNSLWAISIFHLIQSPFRQLNRNRQGPSSSSSTDTHTHTIFIVCNIATRPLSKPRRGQPESNETAISYDKLSLHTKNSIYTWEGLDSWMSTDDYAIYLLTQETRLMWLDLRKHRYAGSYVTWESFYWTLLSGHFSNHLAHGCVRYYPSENWRRISWS